MDSLEDNFPYALMGKSNFLLYPYITNLQFPTDETINNYRLKPPYEHARLKVGRRRLERVVARQILKSFGQILFLGSDDFFLRCVQVCFGT